MSAPHVISEEALEELAKEWLFYDTRFGIVAEMHNGRWSDEQIAGMARRVLALLAELRERRSTGGTP